jgi:hypothetical protein
MVQTRLEIQWPLDFRSGFQMTFQKLFWALGVKQDKATHDDMKNDIHEQRLVVYCD